MKILAVFLLLCVSFSSGKNIFEDTKKVLAPPTALVGMNVTWTFTSQTNTTNVVMVVKRLGADEWAALGLGQRTTMGETHVFMCKRLANDTVVINRYANTGSPHDHEPPAPAGIERGGLFTPLPSTFVDGIVTCQFNLSNFTSPTFKQSNGLDPLSQSRSYHPIFAVGDLNTDNSPKEHSPLSREASSNNVQLNQYASFRYRL